MTKRHRKAGTPPKFTRGRIWIVDTDQQPWCEVDAMLFPCGLAIHRLPEWKEREGGWKVTHTKSGGALPGTFRCIRDARLYIEGIKHIDWTRNRDELMHDEQLYRACKSALQELGL